MISAGTRTLIGTENPNALISHAGNIRSVPSRKPMYQSGCEPAEISPGLYGPNSHTGLIETNAASSVMTPNVMKKKPPALAV